MMDKHIMTKLTHEKIGGSLEDPSGEVGPLSGALAHLAVKGAPRVL
jgi:hypothetical protein